MTPLLLPGEIYLVFNNWPDDENIGLRDCIHVGNDFEVAQSIGEECRRKSRNGFVNLWGIHPAILEKRQIGYIEKYSEGWKWTT